MVFGLLPLTTKKEGEKTFEATIFIYLDNKQRKPVIPERRKQMVGILLCLRLYPKAGFQTTMEKVRSRQSHVSLS